MADIFDDVNEILGDDSMHEEDEKSFNESELQDIMSEIEDLEKEFETSESPAVSSPPPVSPKTSEESLQHKIDRELQESLEEGLSAKVSSKTDILSFDKMPSGMSLKNEVAFAARGSMSLNLDFNIGHESAKLCIDPVKGLVVTLSGVQLCINEEEGCIVTMENGMKFTIPLSSWEKQPKKKSA
jgi:hypothetical protein